MFTTDEILEQLRAGADMDAIASSFTETLNKARELYEKETSAAAKRTEKREALVDILCQLQDFMYTYFPDYFTDKDCLSEEDWGNIADEFLDRIDVMLNILDAMTPHSEKMDKSKPRGLRAKVHVFDDQVSDDQIIRDILAKLTS